jgi:hypothetical protein
MKDVEAFSKREEKTQQREASGRFARKRIFTPLLPGHDIGRTERTQQRALRLKKANT